MPSFSYQVALTASLYAVSTLASPTPAKPEAVTKIALRQASSSTAISNSAQLSAALSSFSAGLNSPATDAALGQAILTQIAPAAGPTSIPQALAELGIISSSNLGNIFQSGADILLAGLAGGDYAQIANGYTTESNTNNTNTREPATPVYPQASPADAPYSLSEADLRKVIYIPPGFTYGQIQGVVFLPGTGAVAGQNFGPNYGKLFMQNKIADPVYVNIPQENLADIQVAAEYAAYAINYISGISGGKNVRIPTHLPSPSQFMHPPTKDLQNANPHPLHRSPPSPGPPAPSTANGP